MAGVGGLYSGIRGLDLGPTKLRNDEEARRKQMAEDMRRALMGEKLQASELLLRENAEKAKQEAAVRNEALQRELQGNDLGFKREEGIAQRGFLSGEAQLDRTGREVLQGKEFAFRKESDERRRDFDKEIFSLSQQGEWDRLGAQLSQKDDQFTKEMALKNDAATREEKFDIFRRKSMELQNTLTQMQIAGEQRRQQGQMSPEEDLAHQRAMRDTERKLAAYQLETARYAQGKGRQMQEAAAGQDLFMGQAQEENVRARTIAQDLENTKAVSRGGAAAGAPAQSAVQKYAKLDKPDRAEAARVDRLVSEGKASDVQTAIAKGWQKINELSADDDDDAKDRIKKIRAFIAKAKKDEKKNWRFNPLLGAWAPAYNAIAPDSDLENEAEELGLHSGL